MSDALTSLISAMTPILVALGWLYINKLRQQWNTTTERPETAAQAPCSHTTQSTPAKNPTTEQETTP